MARVTATSGARTARAGIGTRLAAWLANHRAVATKSLADLLATWVSSLMTWLVIGVALALPTLMYLLLGTIGDISGDWRGKPRLSVYLEAGVPAEAGRALALEFATREDVQTATWISQAEALEEFQAFSGFGDVLLSLDENPLPALIEIAPSARDAAALRALAEAVEAREEVASVSVDLEWIERLYAILALGERFVVSLALFLSLGVLLSIGNTIRLAIENRRAEIEVVKLVGGTDGFVRRPFLYLGLWYGFGGAVVALAMVQLSLLFLSGPLEDLLKSYEGAYRLSNPGFATAGMLLAGGAGLGIAGAWLAVRRHLYQIEPQ